MTRYFYTDPLAAAWMAKHFGMMFGIKHNGTIHWNCIGWADGPFSPIKETADILCTISNHHDLYVHPDSVHLLEPQVDDAVEFDRWYWERQRRQEAKDYPYQAHYAKVIKYGRDDKYLGISSAGIGWDNTVSENPKFSLPFKIIQRNGIPFMSPESEESEAK